MKQIHWIILSAVALLGIAACTHTEEPMEAALKDASTTRVVIREILTVETDTVGILAEKIGDQRETVQKLIISGPINAADVDSIRNLPNLLALDLKDATICGGNTTYRTTHIGYGEYNEYKLYDNVIGQYMFYLTNLSEIVLPDNITEIDEYAFYQLNGSSENPFASIIIPEGVTIIKASAFSGCSNLKKVTLPSTLKEIGRDVFYSCAKLETINLSEVEAIGDQAFENCTSLKTVTLSENLQSLGNECFAASGLTNIDLPESTMTYGYGLFNSCKSLVTATLPDNLETITDNMFYRCTSLERIVIPEGIHTINRYSFADCTSLSEVILPQQLEVIQEWAFNRCSHLTQIEFPASLKSIHKQAFQHTGLTSIVIPENVESIGEGCFEYCDDLKTANINTTTEDFELVIGIFQNCFALENLTLPETLRSIGGNCFYACSSLKSVNWPSNLKAIHRDAFHGSGLTEAILPDQLEQIWSNAFAECNHLTTASITSSLTYLETSIFRGCYNLTSIFWHSNTAIPNGLCGSTSDMNRNVLLYLSNGSTQVQDPNLHNIILEGVADEITLTSDANSPFFVPQEFRAVHVTYSRDFTYPTYPGEASGWRSISLPFTVDNITGPAGQTLAPFNADVPGAKPFWLRRLTENGFENVTQIEAGVPYIIAMPNNEAYDDEYNISGTVTFTASNSAGILFPDSLEMTQDVGPAFIFNASYSYHPASTAIYALNEENTNYYAGSRFVRNERGVLPFEGYVSNSVITSNAPRYYDIDAGRPATRAARPLGPVPSIDDM